MKRIFKFLMAFVVFFFLSSCSDSSHTHDYSSSWSFDENNHWHECISTEGICDKKKHNESPHNFDDGVLLDNATIGGNPVFAYTCMDCGFIKKEGKEHIHNYDILKFDDTHHWYECSSTLGNCPLKVSKKEAHNFNEGELKPASNNIFVYTCTTCGFTKEKVKQHIHNYSTSWSSDESYHFHECLNKDGCDEPVIDLLPHKFDQGKVVQEPIDGKDGTKEFICLDCGYKKYEAISFLNENTNFEALNSDIVTEQEWINAFNYNNVTVKAVSSSIGIGKYDEKNNELKLLTGDSYIHMSSNGTMSFYEGLESKYVNPSDNYYDYLKECLTNYKNETFFKKLKDKYDDFKYDEVNNVYVYDKKNYILLDEYVDHLSIKFNGGKISQIRFIWQRGMGEPYNRYFYDYDKTIIDIDTSLLDNMHHCNYKEVSSSYSCKYFECNSCSHSISIDHEYKLVNSVLPTLNSNGEDTYECSRCKKIDKRVVEYNYKESDIYNNIVGENSSFDLNLSYEDNFTVKYHDVNNNKDIILKRNKIINSIENEGKVFAFKHCFDFKTHFYKGLIVYDGIKTQKISKDDPNINNINSFTSKYYDFLNFLERLDWNCNFNFNEEKHMFEIDLNGNVIFNNFLDHETIRFTKFDYKVKNEKLLFADIEFIDEITKENCHYNITFYDYENTEVPYLKHYHRFTKEILDEEGNIFLTCEDLDNSCDGNSILKHNHFYELKEYIKPTSSTDGKKIYRCYCGKEKVEILKKILDENSDFENIISERNWKENSLINAKVKILNVDDNTINYYNYDMSLHDYNIYQILSNCSYDETKNSFIDNNRYEYDSIEIKLFNGYICYIDVIQNNNGIKKHYKIYIYNAVVK